MPSCLQSPSGTSTEDEHVFGGEGRGDLQVGAQLQTPLFLVEQIPRHLPAVCQTCGGEADREPPGAPGSFWLSSPL